MARIDKITQQWVAAPVGALLEHRKNTCLAAARTLGQERRLTAHPDDLHLASHGVALHGLTLPHHAVGHRDDRIGILKIGILANQETREFQRRREHSQLLEQPLQRLGGALFQLTGLHDKAQRVDEDPRRTVEGNLVGNAPYHLLQITAHRLIRQIGELNRLVQCQDV